MYVILDMVNVRKGSKNDMDAVFKLIKELAVFENEPEAVHITVDDLKTDGFGENPLFYTFVAEQDNEIIGVALYYNRYSTWKGKTIHLEDLIVTDKKRGTGAGTALFRAIFEEAKRQKVKRVEWNVLDWNSNAILFYEKYGAKVFSDWRVVHMDENGIEMICSQKK